jgi:hypothetical protein
MPVTKLESSEARNSAAEAIIHVERCVEVLFRDRDKRFIEFADARAGKHDIDVSLGL